MMEALNDGAELKSQYKGWSWFAHGIIAPILAYDWTALGQRAAEKPESQEDIAPGFRVATDRLVRASWDVVVKAGLPGLG